MNSIDAVLTPECIDKTLLIDHIIDSLKEANKRHIDPKKAAFKALEALAAYKALTGLLDRQKDFELINDLYFLYLDQIRILCDRTEALFTINEFLDYTMED